MSERGQNVSAIWRKTPAPVRRRLLTFALSAVLAIDLGFVRFDSGAAVAIVKHTGYWLMLLTVLLFGREWIRALRSALPPTGRLLPGAAASIRGWGPPILFILAGSALLLQMQATDYKIVMDEPVLAATSLQMHAEREAMTLARGYEVDGVFHLLGGYVDKRPYFFPFLVSLLHDLTGYRSSNGFLLNALLTPLFLGLLFHTGRAIGPPSGGYLAVGLFMTVPLLAFCINSGGFDFLNLLMLLVTGWAAWRYLHGRDAGRLNCLILSVILLAQTRYESALFVLPVAAIILLGWLRAQSLVVTWTAVLAPLLLVPLPLLRSIVRDYPGFWQLDEAVANPFGPEFLPGNLAAAGRFFFDPGAGLPNSWLLSLLSAAALAVLAWRALRRRGQGASSTSGRCSAGWICGLLFSGGVLVNFGLLMSYHWGELDDIMATRLALPILLLQVLLVVWASRNTGPRQWIPFGLGLACLLFFVSWTRPVCAATDFLERSLDHREVNWIRERARGYAHAQPLFLTNRHVALLAERYSALPIERGMRRRAELELHRRLGTFGSILLFHRVETGAVDPPEGAVALKPKRLADAFELETLEEYRLSDSVAVRLSRVSDINVPPEARLPLPSGDDLDAPFAAFARTLP